jgi:hypothetical protein
MTASGVSRAAAVASRSDHTYLGIRPADATPAESPAAIVEQPHEERDIVYALAIAVQHWPECSRWALVGSDETLARQAANLPPRVLGLRKPAQLMTFDAA